MRGRLTDTEENRAAADFLRARFERMGLKPAAPNGSYFQNYNLMTATLGDGGGQTPGLRVGGGALRGFRAREGVFSHSVRPGGAARGPGGFCGIRITAAHPACDR